MMYGYIYITKNNINGKQYIGQHKSQEFDTTYIGSGIALKKAIDKYGKENFTCTLVCECLDRNELNAKEKEYIHKFNAVNSDMFYNIASGGEGGVLRTGPLSEETKLKISKSNTGKIRSAEQRKKQSDFMKGNNFNSFKTRESITLSRKKASQTIKQTGVLAGINNPMYGKIPWNKGKPMSEQQKLKISQTRLSKNITAHNNGKIIVHKENNSKYILPEELSYYEQQGYTVGGLKRVPLRYIHRGDIEKRVREEYLDEYINEGWEIGRTKHTRKKK